MYFLCMGNEGKEHIMGMILYLECQVSIIVVSRLLNVGWHINSVYKLVYTHVSALCNHIHMYVLMLETCEPQKDP